MSSPGVASVLSEGKRAGDESPALRVLFAVSISCGANLRVAGRGACLIVEVDGSTMRGVAFLWFRVLRSVVSMSSGLKRLLVGLIWLSHSSANLSRLFFRFVLVVVSTGSGANLRRGLEFSSCAFEMFLDLALISMGSTLKRRGGAVEAMMGDWSKLVVFDSLTPLWTCYGSDVIGASSSSMDIGAAYGWIVRLFCD